jgi:hypothetical protein
VDRTFEKIGNGELACPLPQVREVERGLLDLEHADGV